MLSSPSPRKRRQLGQSALLRRSTGAASGSSSTKAMHQRSRFSVIGEAMLAITRPSTALPAHMTGGTVSSNAAVRVTRR